MVNRDVYIQEFDQLKKICDHYDNEDFEDTVLRLQQVKNSFDIKILTVGQFNAGKSALLNGLIGRSILKEGQLPETTIAAELKYGEEDSVYAYIPNGEKVLASLEGQYSPDRYDHIEYIINSEGLKQVSDFTIVDTPGFDSAIEEHNKALASYLGMGAGYLLVIDVEEGGVDNTTLRFLEEISQYSDRIAVLINKCDKMIESNINLVAQAVKDTLAMNGYNYPVYTISKYDSDVMEKLDNIILLFDAQSIFNETMRNSLLYEARSMYNILRITASKLYLNTFDMDEQIRKNEQASEHLALTFETKKRSLLYDINQETECVINAVRGALTEKAGTISQAIVRGNITSAEAIIVETVRPVILGTMKNMVSEQIDSIAKSLDFTGLMVADDSEEMEDIVYDLVDNLKQMINQGIFESALNDMPQKGNNPHTIYHVVAGLASIATNIIAPWMEIIVILLPDIISVVSRFFSEDPGDKAESLFIDDIIPQICNKLYPQIRKAEEDNLNIVTDQLQELLDKKLLSVNQNIEQAKTNKNAAEKQFREYQDKLECDIHDLGDLIKKMEVV